MSLGAGRCQGALCQCLWGLVLAVGVSLLTPALGAAQPRDSLPASAPWHSLASGLDFAELPFASGAGTVAVLRIDPNLFDFVLCAAAQNDVPSATLRDWAVARELLAAINASMYLPDGRTSTGYMRFGEYVNNKRVVDRFGAFFVAGPRRPGLPRARIIERDEPGWRETLDEYELVIQNYRMTNAQGRVLWSPGGPLYAISAVAQDGMGRILFLHSREPMEAHAFVQGLLSLPLDVRTVMYVEGGGQAGMVVNTEGLKRDLGAIHPPSLLITGNLRATLPNVLGIKARESGQNSFTNGQN